MTAKIIEIVVLEVIAAWMFFLAYLIGVKRRLNLIAGYNEKTAEHVTDKDGLARLVVRLLILVGAFSALMPVATSLWGSHSENMAMCIGAYMGFVIGVLALTILQAREFTT